MRHYEVVAVIHPDQQGRIAAMIEVYKNIVTDGGGVLHRLEDWGRRPLAYPIQNQHKAQYVLMNIECGDETLDKLRETFRFSDSIIRSLIVRCDRAITDPSVVMKQAKAREDDEDAEGVPMPPRNGRGEKSAAADSPPPAADSDSKSAPAESKSETPPVAKDSSAAASSPPAAEKPKAEDSKAAADSLKTESAKDAESVVAAGASESKSESESDKGESEKVSEEKENDK